MISKKLKIFENCIPIKGYQRAIICDLQNFTYEEITVEMYRFITVYDSIEIKKIIKTEGKAKAKKAIDFLLKNNFAFLTDFPEKFPKINYSFNYPFEISNAVINSDNPQIIEKVINELDTLHCKFAEFILEDNCYDSIFNISNTISEKEMLLSSIGFTVKYEKNITQKKLISLLERFPRISYILVMNHIRNHFIPPVRNNNSGYIIFSKQSLSAEKSCGTICSGYFTVNIKLFTESQQYNSCLYKKIAIDKAGNIKNCLSMPESFGNINKTAIKEILAKPDFKKYWNLTKDKIEICKDCEFRYICTDCRAFTEQSHINKEGLDISKPLKCGYDPYSGNWEAWSTNPLKQKTITAYGL